MLRNTLFRSNYMRIKDFLKRTCTILMSAAMIIGSLASMPVTAYAKNFLFITDISLAAGEDAYDTLEEAGYSVMTVSLNAAGSDETPVYIGYKLNEGNPVTNVILSYDIGSSFETEEGIRYERASETDVDEGIGGGTGCVYFTRNSRAGEPLVGLYVMCADTGDGDIIYPITNDGAEVVRRDDGTPADLERQSETVTIYLAQIRDGIVKPYISEIAVVSGEDRMDAVTIAASHGYNYYAEGDIDGSNETYTILAYERTADENEAITNITALSAEMADLLEENQIIATEESEEENAEAPEEENDAETPEITDEEPGEESSEEEPFSEESEEADDGETDSEEEFEPEEEPEQEEVPEEEEELENEEDYEAEGEPEAEEDVETEELENDEDLEFEEFENEEEYEPEEEEEYFEGEEEEEPEEDYEEEEESEEEEQTEESTTSEEAENNESDAEESEPEDESNAEEPGADEIDLMKAAAVDISGIEYVRISGKPVSGDPDYFLYATKDAKAGNPISMLYADDSTDVTETLFGMWSYGFFASQGVTSANSYVINEDLLNELMNDKSVYINVPVYLLDVPQNGITELKEISPDETPLTISLLTAKEGLPEERYVINGIREPSYEPPVIDRDENQLEESTLPSSVFSKSGYWSIAAGVIAIIAAAAGVVITRKRRKTEDNIRKMRKSK